MNIKLKTVIAFICIALFYSEYINAAFVEVDLYSENDSLVTLDNAAGLEWLDVTETNLISYNNIRANSTGLFDHGFRIATESEILSLYTNAGITAGPPRSLSNTPGVQQLIDLLGCNFCSTTSGIIGASFYYYDEIVELQGNIAFGTYSIGIYGDGFASTSDAKRYSSYADGAYANISTLLVRDATHLVPVPSAVILFCSGLLGLIGFSRQ